MKTMKRAARRQAKVAKLIRVLSEYAQQCGCAPADLRTIILKRHHCEQRGRTRKFKGACQGAERREKLAADHPTGE